MSLFLDFITNLKHVGLEWYKRYYSTYPAIVVDNNDPQKRGRILFKCPTIFGADFVSQVWADPSDFRLAGPGQGEFFPPYIGEWVEMCFEYGDTNNPIYHGGFFAAGELPADFASDYPNVRGWVFKSGNKILVGESDGKEFISITHKSGSFWKMNPDGSITTSCTDANISVSGKTTVKTDGDSIINTTGKVDITAGGDANVTAGGNVIVKGSKIQLNGSSGMVLTTVTDPVVDMIVGVSTMGVPTVLAG